MTALILEQQADRVAAGDNGTEDRPPLIRLEGLTKIYSEGGASRAVLDALDREFYAGEFVCLLGKSGSGKSTLLNLISGIDTPSRGSVIFRENGGVLNLTTLERAGAHALSPPQHRHHLPVLQPHPDADRARKCHAAAGTERRQAGNPRDRAQALLDRVGLGNRLATYPDKLSGGEQQRVAIARALSHDPLLILADEPTGNLDEDTGDTVLALLLELTRDAGKTLFMATHAPEVARLADRVLHLDHGKLVSDQAWRVEHEGMTDDDKMTMGQRAKGSCDVPHPSSLIPSKTLGRTNATMTSTRPIYRLAWRHALRRPLQSLFFIVGVAIGVAMIVAIDLANGSAERAFQLGTETVTGKATHQIIGGPAGLDEALYTRLRTEAGYRLSAPVVESYVVADELDAQPMRLLGVDPFAEAPFRSYLGAGDQAQGPSTDYLAELMVTPNTVLLSTDVAARYGLAVGRCHHGAPRHGDDDAHHRRPARAVGRPEPPRAGWPADRRHRHRAGGAGQGGPARPHRPDRAGRRGGRRDAGAHCKPSCRRRADRPHRRARRHGQRDDRGLSAQPDRAEPAGAGRRHVSHLQHRHLQRRPAAAGAGQPARAGHDARRDLRADPGRSHAARRAGHAAGAGAGRAARPRRGADW